MSVDVGALPILLRTSGIYKMIKPPSNRYSISHLQATWTLVSLQFWFLIRPRYYI